MSISFSFIRLSRKAPLGAYNMVFMVAVSVVYFVYNQDLISLFTLWLFSRGRWKTAQV